MKLDYDFVIVGSGLAGLCDNTSGFWHSVYKDEPGNPEVGPYYYDDTFGHYFQVRLNTPLEESFRLAYWVRADYDPTASAPSEVRLYYSNSAQPVVPRFLVLGCGI